MDAAERDEAINRAITELLAAQSQWLDCGAVRADVLDGVVRLTGELDGRADAQALVWEFVRLPGVTDVETTGLRFREDRGLYLDPGAGG